MCALMRKYQLQYTSLPRARSPFPLDPLDSKRLSTLAFILALFHSLSLFFLHFLPWFCFALFMAVRDRVAVTLSCSCSPSLFSHPLIYPFFLFFHFFFSGFGLLRGLRNWISDIGSCFTNLQVDLCHLPDDCDNFMSICSALLVGKYS